jgi:hypothetical protein
MSGVIKNSTNRQQRRLCAAAAALATLGATSLSFAQAFSSGSTGADGAFDLTGTPANTVVDFNPKALRVNKDPNLPFIDPEGDNVFHFTTITIPANVTVRLSAKWTNGPVYWLATGAVNVAGTINLSGEDGHARTLSTQERRPSVAGPGGFPGGIGGNQEARSRGVAQPGAGPNGGKAGGPSQTCGGYYCGQGGQLAGGNKFLVPIVGGSGGGGGSEGNFEWWGAGGGGGGGALLLSSSTSITVTGVLNANGGRGGLGQFPTGGCSFVNNYSGGGGAGGSVRLVAPVMQGNGTISVSGNNAIVQPSGCLATVAVNTTNGANGKVRIEAMQHSWTYSIPVGSWSNGSPLNSFVPTTPPPSIQVTGVAGQAVRPDPTGAFDAADVTINSSEPVEITIQARYVPVGTVPKITLFSLEGNDQQLDASPLAGTLEQSTSTVTATFPAGFSRGYVRAVWTPAP